MSRQFLTAKEVAEACGVSKSYAYKICKKLNAELDARGFLTIPGKVPARYFEERIYGKGLEEDDECRIS